MTKRQLDIVTGTMASTVILVFMSGEVLGIYLGYKFHNYLFLSFISFLWLKMIRESFFKERINVIFLNNKYLKNKYPHTIMTIIRVSMIITFIISVKSFISFCFYLVMSYYYIEAEKMKQLERKV